MRHTIPLLALLLLACAPQAQPEPATVSESPEFKIVTPFIELEPELVSYSAYSGITRPVRTVIPTQDEWEQFWIAHMAHVWNPGRPPQVDFDKNIVLVTMMGEQATGGYEIKIRRVVYNQIKRSLHVYYDETKPGPNTAALQSLTYPSYIVKVERVPYKAVIFEKE